MDITSYNFRELRKWNRKAGRKRNIRMGVTVDTNIGVGIVTHRDKDEVWVSTASTDGVLWGHTYKYSVDDVSISESSVDTDSKLYRYSWGRIWDNAMDNNASHVVCKQRVIVNEFADKVKCKRETRDVVGFMGSTTYTRFIGDGFDFEINLRRPFIPDGDRVLYVIGISDRITTMDGYGRVGNRKIEEADVMVGKAKLAFNVDEEGNKSWD